MNGTQAPAVFARNLGWNMLGTFGAKLLAPLFQLLIARLLLPHDYGAFAVVLAWLALFDMLKDAGLGQAILVKRRRQDEALKLQFTVQAMAAGGFVALSWLAAPAAAQGFGMPALETALPLAALAAVAAAIGDPMLTDALIAQRYRLIAAREGIAAAVAGTTGLALASAGHGVHALVVGYVAGHAAAACVLALRGARSLGFCRDLALFHELLALGKHIVVQRAFGYLVGQADALIVGKVLGAHAVGVYRMGGMLASFGPAALVPPAQQVVFTEILARREPHNMRLLYNGFFYSGAPCLLAYSISLFFAAPYLVPTVLGEQWRDAVPLLQLFTAGLMIAYLTPLNLDLAKALGFARAYTWYASVRSVLTVLVVLTAASHSLIAASVAWVLTGLVASIANEAIFHTCQKLIPLTRGKIALNAAGWIWAAVAIMSVLHAQG